MDARRRPTEDRVTVRERRPRRQGTQRADSSGRRDCCRHGARLRIALFDSVSRRLPCYRTCAENPEMYRAIRHDANHDSHAAPSTRLSKPVGSPTFRKSMKERVALPFARSITMMVAREPGSVRFPASVDAIASVSQAASGRGR